jgi:hypothetical protein
VTKVAPERGHSIPLECIRRWASPNVTWIAKARQNDGTDGDGKPLHSEWTGKYDGKDYPVTGDPSTDMRSYKKVNDHTLAFTNKKGDKVTISGHGVVSADGKTRTVTITGTDSKGKKYTSTAVYDKQ